LTREDSTKSLNSRELQITAARRGGMRGEKRLGKRRRKKIKAGPEDQP
jgi:hypothetical protein